MKNLTLLRMLLAFPLIGTVLPEAAWIVTGRYYSVLELPWKLPVLFILLFGLTYLLERNKKSSDESQQSPQMK